MSTNYVDSLLSKIEDESLRVQLTNEFGKLRDNKEFGLVFERHIPEYVRLHKREITEGAHVQLRSSKSDDIFTVREIKGEKAIIADKDGSTRDEELVNLVVVIRHGDSIYPGLIEVDRVERGGDKPFHTVINAENYHALQLLLYTHEGKIDCIYIDPPYNTGAKDWKYNNDYVDSEDRYRHSKWLSFMERRLIASKPLLKDDGVIIVTIDEHEVSRLGLLLEQLFPEARIQKCTIVNNAAGVSQGGLWRVEEYAYFCWFGNSSPCEISDDLLSDESKKKTTPIWFSLTRSGGENASAEARSGLIYPIGIDPETLKIIGTGPSLKERIENGEVKGDPNDWRPNESETYNGKPVIWPWGSDNQMFTWQLGPETLMSRQEEGFIRVNKYNGFKWNEYSVNYIRAGNIKKIKSGEISTKGRKDEDGPYIITSLDKKSIPKTVWKRKAHDAGKWGSRTLRELLGSVKFNYAKSPYAVLDCLKIVCSDNPNAIILDYFGGSGTTIHSTMMLNSEDQGNRVCILITNNAVDFNTETRLIQDGFFPGSKEYESKGIFEAVTSPRISAAVSGIRENMPIVGKYRDGKEISEGYQENVRLFNFEHSNSDYISRNQSFGKIAPLLWMISGGVGSVIEEVSETFKLQLEGKYGILFEITHWQEFVNEVKQRGTITHSFIVTDSKVQYQQVVKHLPTNIETTMLYEDYLRNFQVGV